MSELHPYALFSLQERVAVITGGAGGLGSVMVRVLARAGAQVIILNRTLEKAEHLAKAVRQEGGKALALRCDVLRPEVLRTARQRIVETFGRVDILINAAEGNRPAATTAPDQSFFRLSPAAMKAVFDLNLFGTIYPCQVFGERMAEQGNGVILNITSMTALRPLTRVVAYSAAKAAVANFTAWLAVTMAREYSPAIRVNALAPGFFVTEQNRFLLVEENGEPSPRGRDVLAHTPMGRFGEPEDLAGAVLFLVSDASRFVTGTVVTVDGGFSAFAGV